MSQENVEIVKRAYDAYIRRDLDGSLENYDADVTFNPNEEPAVRGHVAVRAHLERWEEPWEKYEVEVEELIDAGEQVVVTVRFKGRGKGSGVEIEARSHQVFALRDGKIVRMDEYTHRDDALEAAGLRQE
jgi:ketosteroid isomerase-like protein